MTTIDKWGRVAGRQLRKQAFGPALGIGQGMFNKGPQAPAWNMQQARQAVQAPGGLFGAPQAPPKPQAPAPQPAAAPPPPAQPAPAAAAPPPAAPVDEGSGWDNAKMVGSLIPGVGTAISGYDAVQDFRNGRWWSGLGNLGMAGLGLLPGVGGLGSTLIRGGARLAKAVGTGGRLAKTVGRIAPAMQNAGHAADTVGRGIQSAMPVTKHMGGVWPRVAGQIGSGVGGGVAQAVADSGPPQPEPVMAEAPQPQQPQQQAPWESLLPGPRAPHPMSASYQPEMPQLNTMFQRGLMG